MNKIVSAALQLIRIVSVLFFPLFKLKIFVNINVYTITLLLLDFDKWLIQEEEEEKRNKKKSSALTQFTHIIANFLV